VSPSTNSDFQSKIAGDVDRIDDIGNPAASGYERRLLVHHPVVDSPRLIIGPITGPQQLTRKCGRNPGNSLRNGRL
jgi:ABC-type phosphonate transport system ATPase subunit